MPALCFSSSVISLDKAPRLGLYGFFSVVYFFTALLYSFLYAIELDLILNHEP